MCGRGLVPAGVVLRYWHAALVVSLPVHSIYAVGAAIKLRESTNFGVNISLIIRSCNNSDSRASNGGTHTKPKIAKKIHKIGFFQLTKGSMVLPLPGVFFCFVSSRVLMTITYSMKS